MVNNILIDNTSLEKDYKKNIACSTGDVISIIFLNDNSNNDVFIRELMYSPNNKKSYLVNNIITDSFNNRQLSYIKDGKLCWGGTYRFKVL